MAGLVARLIDRWFPPAKLPGVQVRFRCASNPGVFQLGYEFLWKERDKYCIMKVIQILPTENPAVVEIVAEFDREVVLPVLTPEKSLHEFDGKEFCVRCRMFKRNPKFDHVQCPGEPEWFRKQKTS